jgi:hypothetical protein
MNRRAIVPLAAEVRNGWSTLMRTSEQLRQYSSSHYDRNRVQETKNIYLFYFSTLHQRKPRSCRSTKRRLLGSALSVPDIS